MKNNFKINIDIKQDVGRKIWLWLNFETGEITITKRDGGCVIGDYDDCNLEGYPMQILIGTIKSVKIGNVFDITEEWISEDTKLNKI